jgi:hypothetical protein
MKKLLLLTTIVSALGVPWASADVEVRIINTAGGGDTGWVLCSGAAVNSCSTSGAVGNYDITSNIAIKDDGGATVLDLSYDAHTSVSNAGTIIFEAIATGYNLNLLGGKVEGNGNSPLGDTVSLATYGGNNNSDCAAGVNTCTPTSLGMTVLSSATGLAEPLNYSAATGGSTVNPYSLAIVLSLDNPTGTGTASGDIALDSVPEPTSIVLLGGVLLVTGGGLRRKFRSQRPS